VSKQKWLIKDDSDLYEMIMHGQESRRQHGVPEPDQTELSDVATLKAEWQKLRQARMARHTYYIIIEPVDSHYRAYPLAVPEVVAQGETPQAAKEKVTEALRAHLAEMLAQGKPLPIERKLVDTVVISLA